VRKPQDSDTDFKDNESSDESSSDEIGIVSIQELEAGELSRVQGPFPDKLAQSKPTLQLHSQRCE